MEILHYLSLFLEFSFRIDRLGCELAHVLLCTAVQDIVRAVNLGGRKSSETRTGPGVRRAYHSDGD